MAVLCAMSGQGLFEVHTLVCDFDADVSHAREIAENAGLDLVFETSSAVPSEPFLHLSSRGLSLERDDLVLLPDFSNMTRRIAPGKLNHELIVRAAKLKNPGANPVAIDATAGLGEDSLCLAACGYTVYLFERDPVIAALLSDAVARAASAPNLSEAASRMHVMEQDSIEAMEKLDFRPELVYLDPMFPERKKSAAVKKKFQLLHLVEPAAQDGERLLEAARVANPRKIIIKRPLKGPYLGDVKPSYSLTGKAIRFDCIVAP